MPIKAVLFDFGDTLVDTPSDFDYETLLKQLHRSLVDNGVAVSYEDYQRAHVEIRDRIYAGNSVREVAFPKRVSEALSRFGYSFEPRSKLMIDATEAFMEPWIRARTMERGVPSVLRKLGATYKLGLVSNFSWSSAVWKTLNRFNICEFFDAVVVSMDVEWRKPSPRIFRKALKEIRVLASEAVFVGDELDHDVEGSQRVGMRAVWLNKESRERNSPIKPDYTINRLEDLPSALQGLESEDKRSLE